MLHSRKLAILIYTNFENSVTPKSLFGEFSKIDDYINSLYELRQESIQKDGEFGEGNLNQELDALFMTKMKIIC